MSTFDYAKAQRTALRLLQRFGQVTTMTRKSAGTFDPGTGATSGVGTTTQEITLASVPGSVGQSGTFSDEFKEQLRKGRIRFFIGAGILATGAPLTFIPAPGDLVTFEGKQWEVIGNTPLSPGGTAVIHEFSAREGGAA
jgi:hypothetical protein